MNRIIRSVNEVTLIGWVASDITIKDTKNGQKLLIFNLATKRLWLTKDNEKKEEVQYHKIACWGRLAEKVTKLLHKGSQVYLKGYLHNRKIKIANEEQGRVITEIIVTDLLVLDNNIKNEELDYNQEDYLDYNQAIEKLAT